MLVEFFQGDLILNWKEAHDKIKSNLKLRDSIMEELKAKYKDELVDSKLLFEMNQYVINRIKSVIKK